jgi:hypothetical protein
MAEPESTDNGASFVRGFIFGAFLTILSSLGWVTVYGYAFFAALLVVGTLCGFLAMAGGDAFWKGARRWVRWLR